MEGAGHLVVRSNGRDGRSRIVAMTTSGRRLWEKRALPKIHAYYESILADFSINDTTHMLHYLLRMLESMERVDRGGEEAG